MNTTTAAPDRARPATPARSEDVCAQLQSLAAQSGSATQYFRSALDVLATHFQAQYATVAVHSTGTSLNHQVAPAPDESRGLSAMADALALESQSENEAIARLYAAGSRERRIAALAVPLHGDGSDPIGAIAMVVDCADRRIGEHLLSELRALVALVGARAAAMVGDAAARPQSELRAIAAAAKYSSLYELAFALVNGLNNKLACQQVALGVVEGQHVRVLSISGLDDVRSRSPGTMCIRQAMEECLDEGDVICCQSTDRWRETEAPSSRFLHKAWHEAAGNAAVASIPLLVEGQVVGVVSLRRGHDQPFSAEEIAKVRELVAPYGPAILLLSRARRSLARHALDSLRNLFAALFVRGSWVRRVAVAVTLVVLAWFCFGSTTYTVAVPCTVTASEMQNFAAPFEGTIRAAHVKEGEQVRAGQPLYEMETRDLELQARRLRSEIGIARVEAAKAFSHKDGAAAAQANARLRAAQARLDVILHQIDQALVRAPSDGAVLRGDLTRRVGQVVPLGAPLLEFAPRGPMSVDLEIPESAASDVHAGQTGTLACFARPDAVVALTVERVLPAAATQHGRNAFLAEATLVERPEWIRVGMEGVARVDAGQRKVWWVALHRAINFARLHLGI